MSHRAFISALVGLLLLAPTLASGQPALDGGPSVTVQDPSSPAGLRGQVTDARTGEPLIEATVKVVKGPVASLSVLTDVDGHYRLPLPPGQYELRVYYDVYPARTISGVEVTAGPPRRLDVQLGETPRPTAPGPAASRGRALPPPPLRAVDEVVVEARADRRSDAVLLEERRRAATVSDAISGQQIQKGPDQNASDAVKRVVSATVTDGRYVVVRGLGGRYSQTLLNGAVLPSPEPDEQAVPLDLFPTVLLANLTLVKTYSPELPGSFSAGALLIETGALPTRFELKLNVGLELNSATSFRQGQSYRGGAYDLLGVDDGGRALPAAVPRNQPVRPGNLTPTQLESIGESFRNVWSVGRMRFGPNLTFNGTAGDTFSLPGGARLGYLAAFGYAHRFRIQLSEVAAVRLEGEKLAVRESGREEIGTRSVTWSALGLLGLQLSRDHEISLLTLFTRLTDIRAQTLDGYSETDGLPLQTSRLQFIARTLSFTQLRGEHRPFGAGRTELGWQANFSLVLRQEPDTRDVAYNRLEGGVERFRNQPGSGERFFSELTDHSMGGSVQLTVPFERWKLRTGGSVQYTARRFDARRFRFEFQGDDPAVLRLPPERLLGPSSLGYQVQIGERTLQSDAYTAALLVGGVFSSADLQLTRKLRLIGGARLEGATQALTPGSPFAITSTPEMGVDRRNIDLLPSLNLVYALTERTNLRAAYSYTLARPRFRELAPFLYFDFSRRRAVSGNPALQDTRIHNADLRWEHFPFQGGVLAATAFYKHFSRPIEQVIFNVAEGDASFANAEAAFSLGGELEARSSLAFLSPRLRELHASANASLIWSRVTLGGQQRGVLTSADRPLQGQSPFVVNALLGWSGQRTGTDINLLYNVHGARISDVGFDRLPDIYEQPFHRLDLSASQRLPAGLRLKLQAANLLDSQVTFKQGEVVVYAYRPGLTVYLGLEWTH